MNGTIRKLSACVLSLAASLFCLTPCHAKVQAWKGEIMIPTYGWAEDINPKFWALEDRIKLSTTVKGAIVYPYTMQDHLYRTKEDRTYKALFLENEYLKVTCLPELGGRLHSVLDKTQNKETFHLNNVIKPSMIAMRGGFISGGVEWNAGPQVHTVTILSPVDALTGENPDGSAYIEVSNLEKTLRTRWTVRVTLHPGKAYLDEKIRIFNPIDAVNPYYFWNCTAYPNNPGTRFIYPMTLGTDHNGVKFFDWPIHEGKDLSWLKNYETWASIFAVDCVFDFFGAYDVDADRGVVQVADHYELSGKKAWTWGTWDFGLVSQKNLTDDDGPYIEVQSGPLPTQSDYGMLLPRQQVAWQEWWYPVHGLGDGFEFATKDLAVQRIEKNDSLQLWILATGVFDNASCSLSRNGKPLTTEKLHLSPKAPRIVTLSPKPDAPVNVTITTREGHILASYITPLPIPEVSPPHRSKVMGKSDEDLSLDEMYLKGRKFDLSTNRKRAREYYEKVLQADPGHAPALTALGVLDIEAALYNQAIERLDRALQRNPEDGHTWYFLGAAHLKKGNAKEAIRCARQAAITPVTASLAFDLAGRAHMALGEHREAVEAFHKATLLNPTDPGARDHHLLALYASGDKKLAFKRAQTMVSNHPTDLVPRALLALQGNRQMKNFARDVRDFVGEDDFEMLETSLVFAELGLYQEGSRVLLAACVDAVSAKQRSPLPLYYLAYFSAQLDDQKAERRYLKQAAANYKDFIFPSRPEALAILKYAISQSPDDAAAHLHIGNLYAHLGRVTEAADHWHKAAELNPALNIAHRNLGLYAWAQEDDLPKAEAHYRRAIEVRPNDQTLYRDLAEILLAQNRRSEAIELLKSTPADRLQRAEVIILLAQSYFDKKRYTEAIDLLESTPYFVNWEGQTITWDLFHKSHMQRGHIRFEQEDFAGALKDFEAALTYPDNIGVGRSNKPQEAPAQYWRGKALQALSRVKEAREAWRLGADAAEGSDNQNNHRKLCADALAETE